MAKSKNYNNWVKENYPRKCNNCEYIANNPAMYSYHAKIHKPIPADAKCYFGCGNGAAFRNTKGNLICKQHYHECPGYLKQLSNRTTKSWQGDEKRKAETKKSFISRLHNQETVNKMKATKKKKTGILSPDQLKDFRQYARRIRSQAQRWAKEQGYVIGQQSYHVDHKLSILDAWKAGLSIEIVNHPANLQILEAKANSSKGANSTITVDELLVAVNMNLETET
jgi:hypothetical protein